MFSKVMKPEDYQAEAVWLRQRARVYRFRSLLNHRFRASQTSALALASELELRARQVSETEAGSTTPHTLLKAHIEEKRRRDLIFAGGLSIAFVSPLLLFLLLVAIRVGILR